MRHFVVCCFVAYLLSPICVVGTEVQQIPVINGYLNVGGPQVKSMTDQISDWSGGPYIFNNISHVEFFKVPHSDFTCSFLFSLNSDHGQLTCFHLEGEDSSAHTFATMGHVGSGSTYETRSSEGFCVFNYLHDNSKTIEQLIYIADTHNNRVKKIYHRTHKFDSGGHRLDDEWSYYSSDFGSNNYNFGQPWDISCVRGDTSADVVVCVSDRINKSIVFFNREGTRKPEMDISQAMCGGDSFFQPRELKILKIPNGYRLGLLADSGTPGAKKLFVLDYLGSSWQLLGSIQVYGAKDIAGSTQVGFFVLGENNICTQVSLEGQVIDTIDFSPGIPSGIQSHGISVYQDEIVIGTEYSTLESGVLRYKVIGGPSYVTTNQAVYIKGAEDVQLHFAVSAHGWYSIVAHEAGAPNNTYQVPGYYPVELDPGVYDITIDSSYIGWDQGCFIRVAEVNGPSDLTIKNSLESYIFNVVHLPRIILDSPRNEVLLDETPEIHYRCFWPESVNITRTEVWVNDKHGNLFDDYQGIKPDNQNEREFLSFEFPWPSYSGGNLSVDVGVQLKVFFDIYGYQRELWCYDANNVPLPVTLIRDPTPGTKSPDPCVAPCFSAGRFSNGRSIIVLGNPCFSASRVFCAGNSNDIIKVYDVRGRSVGQLQPGESFSPGYWSTTFSPKSLGLSSGVYFLKSSNSERADIERVVYIK